MTILVPRHLHRVLVDIDDVGVAVSFELGAPLDLDVPADWFIYGLAVTCEDGSPLKHFGVRVSAEELTAFVYDLQSATRTQQDRVRIDIEDASISVRFADSSLGEQAHGLVSGFLSIEGDDVAVDVAAQLL